MPEPDIIKVLDHGELRLRAVLGGDETVIGSARVSGGADPESASKGPESDGRLIEFLMRNGHGTPFEHAVFQWYVKAPIFVTREWQRHRIGSFNERSGRYAEFEPDYYVPAAGRVQHPTNKQQSVELTDPGGFTLAGHAPEDIRVQSEVAFEAYRAMLASGVAREMARMVLPVNFYTAFWWTVNARSLMNFINLRNSDAAQLEIRVYAALIEQEFAVAMPKTYATFVAHGRRAP